MAILFILLWLFGLAFLGIGSGSSGSSSSGSGRIGPPAKCSQHSGAATKNNPCRPVGK